MRNLTAVPCLGRKFISIPAVLLRLHVFPHNVGKWRSAIVVFLENSLEEFTIRVHTWQHILFLQPNLFKLLFTGRTPIAGTRCPFVSAFLLGRPEGVNRRHIGAISSSA